MAKKYCASCGAHVMQNFLKCPTCGESNWSASPVKKPHAPSPTGLNKATSAPSGQANSGVQISFWSAIPYAAQKTFDPSGRASRSEYWIFTGFNMLVVVALLTLMVVMDVRYKDSIVIYALAAVLLLYYIWMIPCFIMLSIRRFHDLNRSGWWTLALYSWSPLLSAIQVGYPATTSIVAVLNLAIGVGVIVLFSQKGSVGRNTYGPEPVYFG